MLSFLLQLFYLKISVLLMLCFVGGPNIPYEADVSERVRSGKAIGPSPQINNNPATGRTLGFDQPVHKNVCLLFMVP